MCDRAAEGGVDALRIGQAVSHSRDAGAGAVWWRRRALRIGEAVSLQDVVGQGVAEDDGADLVDAAHGQLPEVPVTPAGVNAFADGAELVLCFAGFAGHARAPGRHAGAVGVSG